MEINSGAEAANYMYRALYIIANCDLDKYTAEELQGYAKKVFSDVEVATLNAMYNRGER